MPKTRRFPFGLSPALRRNRVSLSHRSEVVGRLNSPSDSGSSAWRPTRRLAHSYGAVCSFVSLLRISDVKEVMARVAMLAIVSSQSERFFYLTVV